MSRGIRLHLELASASPWRRAMGPRRRPLLRNADIALYLAKTEGRGTVRFFEPEMDAHIHLRRTLELDLRAAIIRNEFELYYQPLINLIAGKVIGFEALLRWHHPDPWSRFACGLHSGR